MLFGLLSIIMDVFKIVSYVGYVHCDSAVKVAFPVVQLVFIVVQVIKISTNDSDKEIRQGKMFKAYRLRSLNGAICLQTYFLWMHAKDCVQVQRNITR